MDVLILFGCNGHVEESGFICCNSIVNPIVDLSKVKKETREKASHFLGHACNLFDAPCNDHNKCVNIINFLYRQFGIISEEGLREIQAFLRMHKRCGIYIMLISKEGFNV
jgi:hypothetical protein